MASASHTTTVASSTLAQPRVVGAVVSTVAAFSLAYYLYTSRPHRPESLPPGPGLRRSNAVRRNRHPDEPGSESDDIPSAGADENQQSSTLPHGLADPIFDQDHDLDVDNTNAPRNGENIVNLLFRVSEDNARRNAYIHRGCQCNSCGVAPIRGIRYRCANCSDYDLCEVCESQSMHNGAHIFYKIRIPAPLFVPRHVQAPWYTGDPEVAPRSLTRSQLTKWSSETGFERVELEALWEQWTFMANTEFRDDPSDLGIAMDRKTFEQCLVPSGGYRHGPPNLIHDRMFAFYDTNGDGLISFEEFLHGVAFRKRRDKLRKIFDGYDVNGDGYVDRRDFLRMFRAYYVLYKQMHSDMLESLDEHMMTTTDVRQHVAGRAPLSGMFGRDHLPRPDPPRFLDGKVTRSDDDTEVVDNKGPVAHDRSDTASREDMLLSLFARNSPQNHTGSGSVFIESIGESSRPDPDSRYISSLINPPNNMVDLNALMQGDYGQLEELLEGMRRDGHIAPVDPDAQAIGDTYGHAEDEGNSTEDASPFESVTFERGDTEPAINGSHNPEHPPPVTESVGHDGPSSIDTPVMGDPRHSNSRPGMSKYGAEKRKRILARRELLERWKRRQFYLDEEEGLSAPRGWDESQDVLSPPGQTSEEATSTPNETSHPGSSSKVEFSDDAEHFDLGSHRTTFSRGLSEKQGAMKIPVPEQDAGKEVLYQVTQQAFNELLDPIFKEKEDLAIRAASTKRQRQENREALDAITLDDDDLELTQELLHSASTSQAGSRSPKDNADKDGSLDDLLRRSGYTVDESLPVPSRNAHLEDYMKTMCELIGNQSHVPVGSEGETDVETASDQQRDLTMPQFRPNSTNDTAQQDSGRRDTSRNERDREMSRAQPRKEDKGKARAESRFFPATSSQRVPRNTLLVWKRLDEAEKQAERRGGWGRLSFEEFEEIYGLHEFADSGRNRLDYLGSWIEFCIP